MELPVGEEKKNGNELYHFIFLTNAGEAWTKTKMAVTNMCGSSDASK